MSDIHILSTVSNFDRLSCPVRALAIALALTVFCGCKANGGGTTTGNPVTSEEDSSGSGAVAASIGGALSGSNSNAQMARRDRQRPVLIAIENFWRKLVPEANAANRCPTFRSSTAGGCSVSAGTMWLDYGTDCEVGSSGVFWSGTQALVMSAGAASCGSFPNPGANGDLVRQFVSSAGSTTPGNFAVRSRFGTTVVIDNQTANLGNFDSATIQTLVNGGYGHKVSFDSSGVRSSVVIAQRVYVSGVFDHSISGNLSVSESGHSLSSTSRTVSGTIYVYHNLVRVIGTSVLSGLVHDDTCCLPVSGTITTTFSEGANVRPTLLGAKMVGKSETLTLAGCGTGTLQKYDGTTESVTLSRCF